MSSNTLNLTESLSAYYRSHAFRDDAVLKALREETAQDSLARMQISPEQGAFMGLLIQVTQTRRILEIGTYTGYSSLCMARALPADGTIIALDLSEEWTAIARRYWSEAGVDSKIDLRLGEARASLQQLIAEGAGFDLIFIDADKEAYRDYYEMGLQTLQPGGLILFDNVLWSGRVADPAFEDPDTQALRALNDFLLEDSRVDLSMLPIGDGLTLLRKR